MSQPGPYLVMTLAVEGAGGEDSPDALCQRRIRHRSDRPAAPRRFRPGQEPITVEGGAGGTPDAADARYNVTSTDQAAAA